MSDHAICYWVGSLCAAHLLFVSIGCGHGATAHPLLTAPSPDGSSTAVVTYTIQKGPSLPGPEPPQATGYWINLTVTKDGSVVFTTGEEKADPQTGVQPLDLAWSPDSSRLAFHQGTDLRIIGVDGSHRLHNVSEPGEWITAIKWVDASTLLVVVKKASSPLPGWPGFLGSATSLRVLRVDAGGVEERYAQPLANPTFLYQSQTFRMNEISPYSVRVAFGDGKAVCVYDDASKQLIAREAVEGKIEGIWWIDDNNVILGIGVLSGDDRFVRVDILEKTISDATALLLPHWRKSPGFQDPAWFRAAFPAKKPTTNGSGQ